MGFKLSDFSTTYFGSDVVITYDGAEYVISPEDADGDGEIDEDSKMVIVGATDVEFELEAPGGSIPYNGATVTAEIDFEANFEVEVDNRPSDLVVLKSGSFLVSATLYNQVPVSNPNSVEVLLDWEDQSLDIDLYFALGDSSGNWLDDYDSSGSVSRYENISLPLDDTYDDSSLISPNDYYLDVNTSWAGGVAANYKFFIAFPDGTLQIMDGTTVDGVADNLQIKVTKTTNVDTELAEYTFEYL